MKSKVLKRVLCLTLAGAMVLGTVGCGGSKDNNNDSNAEKKLAEEQVLRLTMGGEPTILDPYQIQDDNAQPVNYAIHEPLFRIAGEDGKEYEPGLATEVKSNEDATVFTVTLRQGAKWQDGTEFTAEDVVYTLQRAVDPEFASPNANDFFMIKNAEAIVKGEMDKAEIGVKALDDYTVEFTLERTMDYFVDYLKTPGFAPIQKEAGEAHKDLYGSEADKTVASGPFVLDEWVHDNSITLAKNENYWDAENVTVEKVELSITSDKNAIQGMFQTGDIDIRKVGNDELEQYKDDPTLTTIKRLSSSFIEFNLK